MPRWMTCGFAALTLLSGAGSALAAKMYRWVDSQGVVHYSDQPQPGAQVLEIQTAQTYHAPPVPAAARATGGNAAAPASRPASAYSCSISQPGAEESFFTPESVPIRVNVNPELHDGDQLLVTVDGAAVARSGDGMQFNLAQPDRGSHTISATVRSTDGKSVCTASAVTFTVQRPSLLSPASPARGH